MMCFKHLLPYALLLPIPSASPIFVLVFAVQVFYAVRPCGYCLALIAVLFLSSSPSSPFTSLPPPTIPAGIPLNTPVRKTWFDLNHGHFLDPVLYAFNPGSNVTATTEKDRGYEAYYPARLPRDHLDLRYRGLGFVLDFGWTRSEEGVRWEMEDRKAAGSRLNGPRKTVQEEEGEERKDAGESSRKSGASTWLTRVLSSVKGRSGSTGGLLGDW